MGYSFSRPAPTIYLWGVMKIIAVNYLGIWFNDSHGSTYILQWHEVINPIAIYKKFKKIKKIWGHHGESKGKSND